VSVLARAAQMFGVCINNAFVWFSRANALLFLKEEVKIGKIADCCGHFR
jgi:hypothetical protein